MATAITTSTEVLITEKLSYPTTFMKYVYKSPILLYRLGFGSFIGRLFLIMTTTGRKSGMPRRTAVEYHQFNGRKLVIVGWRKSDWYQNLLANPLITIQTASGVERVRARRLTSDEELGEAWKLAEKDPWIQGMIKMSGETITRESFLAQKERFIILTFDRTDEATPPPLKADLGWVVPTIFNILIPVLIARGLRARRQKHLHAQAEATKPLRRRHFKRAA